MGLGREKGRILGGTGPRFDLICFIIMWYSSLGSRKIRVQSRFIVVIDLTH